MGEAHTHTYIQQIVGGYCIVSACVELSMVTLLGGAAESTLTYRNKQTLLGSVDLGTL